MSVVASRGILPCDGFSSGSVWLNAISYTNSDKMDQQVPPPVLSSAFEASAVGGRLASRELPDEPSPSALFATTPAGLQRPITKPTPRTSTALAASAPGVAFPAWTSGADGGRGGRLRRSLAAPTALARLLARGGRPLGGDGDDDEEEELECYLMEGGDGNACRRQRLPFGQGPLARALAADAPALWDRYMALDARQRAGVDRLLRRQALTSTRPRTCVAIAPCGAGPPPPSAARPSPPPMTTAPAAETPPPLSSSPSGFLVFLAVGHPVAPVRFRDPLGRRFEFSFALCRTWAGMEDLLLDCFPRVATATATADDDDNGDYDDDETHSGSSVHARVRRGRYDLLGPDGHIVLPMVWESVVRPGWRVAMVLWPEVPPAGGADGPRALAVPAAGALWWRRALGLLRAPFERPGYFRPPPSPPRAGPPAAAERRRRQQQRKLPPRETWVLHQLRLGGGVGEEEAAEAAAACAAPDIAPGALGRHSSSEAPGGLRRPPPGDGMDARAWYAAALPRHMAAPPPPLEEGDSGGGSSIDGPSSSSSCRASSSLWTGPSAAAAADDDDDGASRRGGSSLADCGSEASGAASLGRGIDDLLGTWTSAGADAARGVDAGGRAGRGKGSEPEGE